MVLHGGGGGGLLQWWSPSLDRQLASLEVAPRNVSGLGKRRSCPQPRSRAPSAEAALSPSTPPLGRA